MIVPNDILFSNVRDYIRAGKEVKVTAKGSSMLPFIRTGDVVTLCKAHRLRTGMVVLVEPSDGVYILHRIVKLNDEDMILYGDGNLGTKEKVSYTSVVAVVKSVYRGNKQIFYGSWGWRLRSFFWPKNKFLRKYSLKVYKKTQKKH